MNRKDIRAVLNVRREILLNWEAEGGDALAANDEDALTDAIYNLLSKRSA